MEEKILCPWCGAEMELDKRGTGYCNPAREAWYVCRVCESNSPTAWGEDYETAVKLATEAALRRYTPQLKPMTLEEALGKDAFLELKWMNSIRQVRVPRHLGERIELLPVDSPIEGCYSEWIYRDDYGETWRCWETMPTDEERSAAEWET